MKSLRQVLGEAIGEASMCWSEIPKGIFDANKASHIVDDLIHQLKADIIFIQHIQNHLQEGQKVICTICSKTAEDILKEPPNDHPRN